MLGSSPGRIICGAAGAGGIEVGLRWSFYEDANSGFLPYQEMFSDLGGAEGDGGGDGVRRESNEGGGDGGAEPESPKAIRHAVRGLFSEAPARAVYTFQAGANSGCRLPTWTEKR